jgi:transaldolase
MQLFLDSANCQEIEKWLGQGVIDGITTNPSILLKDAAYDYEQAALQLCRLLGSRPVSVEVTSNDPGAMLEQARKLARLAGNVVIKVPVVNQSGESCLGVMHALAEEGVHVNATALLSFNQAMLSAKAGAAYVSLFAGRIADEGNDPAQVIGHVRRWLEEWGYEARIIVGSIRSVMDVQNAALAGAHIITVPPQFLPKMVDHQYTRETVRQFVRDAEKALAQAGKLALAV